MRFLQPQAKYFLILRSLFDTACCVHPSTWAACVCEQPSTQSSVRSSRSASGIGSVKDFSQIGLQTLLYRSQPAMEASSMAASRCFIFMCFLLPHWVPATWRSRAQTSMRAELPSGKLPTTRVRRRISRFSRSMTLLVWIRVQCSLGKSQ